MTDADEPRLSARIAEANRLFYQRTAQRYEATETCVRDERMQAELHRDLAHVLRLLGAPARALRCLDACAGTGTVTLKLLTHPLVRVDACDISQEMLDLLAAKTRGLPHPPTLHRGNLLSFLEHGPEQFDLIVFSSALHHLPDYGQALLLCRARLRPGGLVFTTFDPTPTAALSRTGRALVFADYAAFKVLHQTSDAPRALLRRLRRSLSEDRGEGVTDHNVGALAEYHVPHGIDDVALADQMSRGGYRVLWHVRKAEARSPVVRALLDALGDVSSFKLLLEKN